MAEGGDAERSLDPIREEDENEGKYANEGESEFEGEESESGGEREKFGCVDVKEIEETDGGEESDTQEGGVDIEINIEVEFKGRDAVPLIFSSLNTVVCKVFFHTSCASLSLEIHVS